VGLAAKQALLAAAERAARDEAVRAVVLTGTGRVFTAGQDLGEHAGALRQVTEQVAGLAEGHLSTWRRLLAAIGTVRPRVFHRSERMWHL
jgi:2-(1,2-epoxy-1,2-dihydrophenyl)acetyl-CoA isomerase